MIVAVDDHGLRTVLEAVTGKSPVGVDVEGNGLYAYRAGLCVVQLAWQDDGDTRAAVIDPLAVDIAPLAPLLEAGGPVKVLHDLTFDARLLMERGIRLGNVRDTSVAAQLLGEPKIGLATLVQALLGVELHKGLQDHDWGRRPLEAEHLAYLAEDVRHLLALDRALAAAVEEKDIVDEVAIECAYKLATALEPPRDRRPAHARIKGYRELPARGRAVLRRLSEARERVAEAEDVPPFRVAPSGVLLEMARRAEREPGAIDRICRRGLAARDVEAWRAAVAQGLRDDLRLEVEETPPPGSSLPASRIARHKRIRKALADWRRKESEARGVTWQVIIPGHCIDDVALAITAAAGDEDATQRALAAIDGFGAKRAVRYAPALASLGR